MKRFLLAILPAIALLSACDKSNTGTTIQFDTPGNLQISYEGTTDSVFYTITNPVEGGELHPSASDGWITGYDTSVDGILYFTVEENPTQELRSTILTLSYIYDGGEASAQLNIIQDASRVTVFEATYAHGSYYGDQYSTPGMRYYTWLAENPAQGNTLGAGKNYCLDLYCEEPADKSRIAAAPGTYTMSSSHEAGTMGMECRLVEGEGWDAVVTYFASGTLIIAEEGDGYSYKGEFTDSLGNVHRISYTGPVSLYDATNPYMSTLTEDYDLQLDGASMDSYYFGTFYNDATNNWTGTIAPASGNGDAFQIDLCAPLASDFEAGFPTGTFTINETMGANTSIAGFQDPNSGTSIGTWYYEMVNKAMGTRVAPIVSGTLTIGKEGTAYTLTLDGQDDAGNKITASWSGTINSMDMSDNSSL